MEKIYELWDNIGWIYSFVNGRHTITIIKAQPPIAHRPRICYNAAHEGTNPTESRGHFLRHVLQGRQRTHRRRHGLHRHENEMAIKIADALKKKGVPLWLPHQTNQVFAILPNEKIAELEKDFFFYTWTPYDEGRSVIRLITNWNTKEEEVEAVLNAI